MDSEAERDASFVLKRCVAIAYVPEAPFMVGQPSGSGTAWDRCRPKYSVHAALAGPLPGGTLEQLRDDFPVFFVDESTTATFLSGQPVHLGDFEQPLVDILQAELATKAPEVKVTIGIAIQKDS